MWFSRKTLHGLQILAKFGFALVPPHKSETRPDKSGRESSICGVQSGDSSQRHTHIPGTSEMQAAFQLIAAQLNTDPR